MKAMILAAGMGTRLRPLTDDRPKALVTVAGRTLLEMALIRLRSFGINDVIVNTHHHADMISAYLTANDQFGMHIEVSREEILLDTGGGLKRAAHFFLERKEGSREPFILHNVDVMSNIDLGRMLRFHDEHEALASLAVQDRETSRYLLFDKQGLLGGRRAGLNGELEMVRSSLEVDALAFSGIHVISPDIFAKIEGEGTFSIISTYLDLAAKGEQIVAFRADGYYWRDLGRPESLMAATADIANGTYSPG